MPADVTVTQISAVIGAQLVAVSLSVGVALVLSGGVGLVVPMLSMFPAATLAFWRLGRDREDWPQRPAIQRTSLLSAVSFWAISTAGYAAAYAAQPESFGFSAAALVGFAPAVGLLPGFSALVLTMCAGDTAATALRSYDEMKPELERDVDLYERFSVRTQARYGKSYGNRDRTKISGR